MSEAYTSVQTSDLSQKLLASAQMNWDSADAFDRQIVTSMLEKALCDRDKRGGSLANRLGVGGSALAVLLMLYLPDHPLLAPEDYVFEDQAEEQAWVRDLLLDHADGDVPLSRWLAPIVARRAMESAHLWEDLGLANRAMLGALMERHFPLLAARNTDDMRWKRFFFRVLCEDEGLTHCTSPTCSTCSDVERCFTPESAEALIAKRKAAPE